MNTALAMILTALSCLGIAEMRIAAIKERIRKEANDAITVNLYHTTRAAVLSDLHSDIHNITTSYNGNAAIQEIHSLLQTRLSESYTALLDIQQERG